MQAAVDGDPDAIPAWHAHLPSGQAFRIRWVGVNGPFLRLTGMDGDTHVLLAPEAVVISFDPIPESSPEPRGVQVGFRAPE